MSRFPSIAAFLQPQAPAEATLPISLSVAKTPVSACGPAARGPVPREPRPYRALLPAPAPAALPACVVPHLHKDVFILGKPWVEILETEPRPLLQKGLFSVTAFFVLLKFYL